MAIGIYCIQNTVNGKKYIGQSWDIEHRLTMHRLNKKETHLTLSFRKYGIDNFSFSILESFDESVATQSFLDEREIFFIEKFNCLDDKMGYNKRQGGSRGKHTEETKRKVSETKKSQGLTGPKSSLYGVRKTQEARDKMSLAKKKAYIGSGNPFYGKHHTDETRNKIRLVRVLYKKEAHPWYGKHHTDETKKKFCKMFGKSVMCIETGIVYDSQQEAARAYGGFGSSISACIRGKLKTAYKMHWERVSKEDL